MVLKVERRRLGGSFLGTSGRALWYYNDSVIVRKYVVGRDHMQGSKSQRSKATLEHLICEKSHYLVRTSLLSLLPQ